MKARGIMDVNLGRHFFTSLCSSGEAVASIPRHYEGRRVTNAAEEVVYDKDKAYTYHTNS